MDTTDTPRKLTRSSRLLLAAIGVASAITIAPAQSAHADEATWATLAGVAGGLLITGGAKADADTLIRGGAGLAASLAGKNKNTKAALGAAGVVAADMYLEHRRQAQQTAPDTARQPVVYRNPPPPGQPAYPSPTPGLDQSTISAADLGFNPQTRQYEIEICQRRAREIQSTCIVESRRSVQNHVRALNELGAAPLQAPATTSATYNRI